MHHRQIKSLRSALSKVVVDKHGKGGGGGSMEKGRIVQVLMNTDGIRDASFAELNAISELFEEVAVAEEGAVVQEVGQTVNRFTVVAHGRFSIRQAGLGDGKQVGELNAYDYFGEVGLSNRLPVAASIVSLEPNSKLLVMQAAEFRARLAHLPCFKKLEEAHRQVLKKSSVLESLNVKQADDLVMQLKIMAFEQGQIVATKGTSADCFCLVASGSCSVYTDEGEPGYAAAALSKKKLEGGKQPRLREIRKLQVGSFFGEGALLGSSPSKALHKYTIIATSNLVCGCMTMDNNEDRRKSDGSIESGVELLRKVRSTVRAIAEKANATMYQTGAGHARWQKMRHQTHVERGSKRRSRRGTWERGRRGSGKGTVAFAEAVTDGEGGGLKDGATVSDVSASHVHDVAARALAGLRGGIVPQTRRDLPSGMNMVRYQADAEEQLVQQEEQLVQQMPQSRSARKRRTLAIQRAKRAMTMIQHRNQPHSANDQPHSANDLSLAAAAAVASAAVALTPSLYHRLRDMLLSRPHVLLRFSSVAENLQFISALSVPGRRPSQIDLRGDGDAPDGPKSDMGTHALAMLAGEVQATLKRPAHRRSREAVLFIAAMFESSDFHFRHNEGAEAFRGKRLHKERKGWLWAALGMSISSAKVVAVADAADAGADAAADNSAAAAAAAAGGGGGGGGATPEGRGRGHMHEGTPPEGRGRGHMHEGTPPEGRGRGYMHEGTPEGASPSIDLDLNLPSWYEMIVRGAGLRLLPMAGQMLVAEGGAVTAVYVVIAGAVYEEQGQGRWGEREEHAKRKRCRRAFKAGEVVVCSPAASALCSSSSTPSVLLTSFSERVAAIRQIATSSLRCPSYVSGATLTTAAPHTELLEIRFELLTSAYAARVPWLGAQPRSLIDQEGADGGPNNEDAESAKGGVYGVHDMEATLTIEGREALLMQTGLFSCVQKDGGGARRRKKKGEIWDMGDDDDDLYTADEIRMLALDLTVLPTMHSGNPIHHGSTTASSSSTVTTEDAAGGESAPSHNLSQSLVMSQALSSTAGDSADATTTIASADGLDAGLNKISVGPSLLLLGPGSQLALQAPPRKAKSDTGSGTVLSILDAGCCFGYESVLGFKREQQEQQQQQSGESSNTSSTADVSAAGVATGASGGAGAASSGIGASTTATATASASASSGGVRTKVESTPKSKPTSTSAGVRLYAHSKRVRLYALLPHSFSKLRAHTMDRIASRASTHLEFRRKRRKEASGAMRRLRKGGLVSKQCSVHSRQGQGRRAAAATTVKTERRLDSQSQSQKAELQPRKRPPVLDSLGRLLGVHASSPSSCGDQHRAHLPCWGGGGLGQGTVMSFFEIRHPDDPRVSDSGEDEEVFDAWGEQEGAEEGREPPGEEGSLKARNKCSSGSGGGLLPANPAITPANMLEPLVEMRGQKAVAIEPVSEGSEPLYVFTRQRSDGREQGQEKEEKEGKEEEEGQEEQQQQQEQEQQEDENEDEAEEEGEAEAAAEKAAAAVAAAAVAAAEKAGKGVEQAASITITPLKSPLHSSSPVEPTSVKSPPQLPAPQSPPLESTPMKSKPLVRRSRPVSAPSSVYAQTAPPPQHQPSLGNHMQLSLSSTALQRLVIGSKHPHPAHAATRKQQHRWHRQQKQQPPRQYELFVRASPEFSKITKTKPRGRPQSVATVIDACGNEIPMNRQWGKPRSRPQSATKPRSRPHSAAQPRSRPHSAAPVEHGSLGFGGHSVVPVEQSIQAQRMEMALNHAHTQLLLRQVEELQRQRQRSEQKRLDHARWEQEQKRLEQEQEMQEEEKRRIQAQQEFENCAMAGRKNEEEGVAAESAAAAAAAEANCLTLTDDVPVTEPDYPLSPQEQHLCRGAPLTAGLLHANALNLAGMSPAGGLVGPSAATLSPAAGKMGEEGVCSFSITGKMGEEEVCSFSITGLMNTNLDAVTGEVDQGVTTPMARQRPASASAVYHTNSDSEQRPNLVGGAGGFHWPERKSPEGPPIFGW
jgi:CRP-like cAMP-binding protein